MELVPKKKTTTLVWKYFGLEKNEEGRIKTEDIAVCQNVMVMYTQRGQYLKFSIPYKNVSPNFIWACLQCNEV